MNSPIPYYKEQFRERDGEEDKGRNGQTTSWSGLGRLLHNPGPCPQPTLVEPVVKMCIKAEPPRSGRITGPVSKSNSKRNAELWALLSTVVPT